MSQENVALVRRGYEAFNRGDLDGMFAETAPAFEYLATSVVPDAGACITGLKNSDASWSDGGASSTSPESMSTS